MLHSTQGAFFTVDRAFWEQRWTENQIGFHQTAVNPYLQKYFPHTKSRGHCLVPLCGKNLDMAWIAAQKQKITGIEFSEIAVRSFFEELRLMPEIRNLSPSIRCFRNDPFSILQGDFFAVSPDMIPSVDWIYDRAALIALPPDVQTRYVTHLLSFLNPKGEILLITVDYAASEMEGPPFPVSANRVQELFANYGEVRLLERKNILAEEPRFQEKGLTALWEEAFLFRATHLPPKRTDQAILR